VSVAFVFKGAGVDRSAVARVVLDTNLFVAAGFNPVSHSAWLVDAPRLEVHGAGSDSGV
jgi:hypothetical protein